MQNRSGHKLKSTSHGMTRSQKACEETWQSPRKRWHSYDEDRSQLYDKVVQQAGEIHDLEFRLATAKALTGNQGAVEPPTGAASSQHPLGLPVQTTPTVTDMTRQWESPGQGQSEYGTDPASTAGGVSSREPQSRSETQGIWMKMR